MSLPAPPLIESAPPPLVISSGTAEVVTLTVNVSSADVEPSSSVASIVSLLCIAVVRFALRVNAASAPAVVESLIIIVSK